MPELPEVESLRRSLVPVLLRRKLGKCTILRQDVCVSVDLAGKASDATPLQLLQGSVVTELIRRGKHLGVVTSSRVMSVHLGMSGVLEVRSDGDLPPHTHVTWKLGPNQSLIFSDPRRFGGLTAYRSLEALARLSWGSLGPDALQATGEHLRHAAGRSTRPVKALLLDQHALAGVGNIYADESLFLAQVHPQAQCNTLTVDAWERLAASVRQVLASAIEHGGSTIRSYRNGVGSIGRAQERHTVYGRAGKPCLNCGLILSQGDICQRTTVWCEGCQGK